jgi:hypothetical protein
VIPILPIVVMVAAYLVAAAYNAADRKALS